MPIYEYKCECGCVFEYIKLGDDNEIKCPVCGSRKIEKIISLSTFVLKGDGWSNTGYQKIGYDYKNDDLEKNGTSVSMVTKTPIIKDRKTNRVISGPVLPGEKSIFE